MKILILVNDAGICIASNNERYASTTHNDYDISIDFLCNEFEVSNVINNKAIDDNKNSNTINNKDNKLCHNSQKNNK